MSQDYIGKPPSRDPVDEFVDGVAVRVSRPWTVFFSRVFEICFAQAQSGTTAQRPTSGLYPGRAYFDVDLGTKGKKIFCDKNCAGWVDSSGNVV